MKQALTQRLKLKKPKLMNGFSYIVLWPCYFVFTGSLIVATTKLGAAVGFLVVFVPAFAIAIKAAQIHERRLGTSAAINGEQFQQILDEYAARHKVKPKAPKAARQPKYSHPVTLTPATR